MSVKILTNDFIKSLNISGNTGASGTLPLNISNQNYVVVGVKSIYQATPYMIGDKYVIQFFKYKNIGDSLYALTGVTGTDVSATVYYIAK